MLWTRPSREDSNRGSGEMRLGIEGKSKKSETLESNKNGKTLVSVKKKLKAFSNNAFKSFGTFVFL
jgi:hypothetical protein